MIFLTTFSKLLLLVYQIRCIFLYIYIYVRIAAIRGMTENQFQPVIRK